MGKARGFQSGGKMERDLIAELGSNFDDACMLVLSAAFDFEPRKASYSKDPSPEGMNRFVANSNPRFEYRNPKRFDRLTALSRVEGQILNPNFQMTLTSASIKTTVDEEIASLKGGL
jgi:hypothetical protein